jgi:hypothetical protein
VAFFVAGLGSSGGERDELVAHLHERHPRTCAAAKRHVENPPVELERLVHVAYLEGDVVDSYESYAGGHGSILPEADGLGVGGGTASRLAV